MIELVPLPLFSIIPFTGEPGIMIIRGEPGDPVTRPPPRDVVTLEGEVGGLDGAMGWKIAGPAGGPLAGPPGGWNCAKAGAVIAAMTVAIANRNLIIACSPAALIATPSTDDDLVSLVVGI
jgi:hypothetical protein